jgi:hypothetical protein
LDPTDQFIGEVCEELAVLEQYNDETIKPAAVKIVFDKNLTYNSTDTNLDIMNINLQGSISDIDSTAEESDAVVNTVTSNYPTDKWKPSLNNIIEETEFQIQQSETDSPTNLYPATSSKQNRSHQHKIQ